MHGSISPQVLPVHLLNFPENEYSSHPNPHMKNIIIFLLSFCTTAVSYAQKKLNPTNQSVLTRLRLPVGSKQDNRVLSVSGAKMLLEIECKKVNTSISATEVLLIPSVARSGFNADSLTMNLSILGWAISIVEGDEKYAWIQKDNRFLIMYYSMNASGTELYFAEAAKAPERKPRDQTKGTIQTETTNNRTRTQPTDKTTQTPANHKIKQPTQTTPSSGFAFTTTNFDDGWTSTVWEEWVQVVKRDIKVLLHYPNKKADAYNSVLLAGLKNAWDVLVAPKYSSASNFYFKPLSSWQSIEFAEADMTETATGKSVHVVLFKKNFSNGAGRYLEFISPSKSVFEQEFGAYDNSALGSGWDKMANMAGYNKFAVAMSDLKGKWTSDFSGAVQYVNASTGFDAGMATHASAENYQFTSADAYQWDLAVASGFVGNMKFQSVKSVGKYSLASNWQINLSDIEGKPRKYNVHFSCIKGLRILWIENKPFGKVE